MIKARSITQGRESVQSDPGHDRGQYESAALTHHISNLPRESAHNTLSAIQEVTPRGNTAPSGEKY
jgi:hypothetical protein